jgi:hypothetical protein
MSRDRGVIRRNLDYYEKNLLHEIIFLPNILWHSWNNQDGICFITFWLAKRPSVLTKRTLPLEYRFRYKKLIGKNFALNRKQ